MKMQPAQETRLLVGIGGGILIVLGFAVQYALHVRPWSWQGVTIGMVVASIYGLLLMIAYRQRQGKQNPRMG